VADLFISYAHKDKSFVGEFNATLSGMQHVVWIDHDDIPPSDERRKACGVQVLGRLSPVAV
jgi:TIR domain